MIALLPAEGFGALHLVPVRGAREVSAAWSVGEVGVRASVTGDLAKVQIDVELVNTTRRAMEMTGFVPLPSRHATGAWAVLFQGERVDAVRPRGPVGRELILEALRQKRDRSLLRFLGREFLVVPDLRLPPQSRRTLSVRYELTLEAIRGVRTLSIPLWGLRGPEGSAPRLRFDVHLRPYEAQAKRGAPSAARTRIGPVIGFHHAFDVSRREDDGARVTGTRVMHPLEPDLQFAWSEGRGPLGMTLLSTWPEREEYGTYLLALRASEVAALSARPRGRDVVWLVDASGSMAGERYDTVKAALLDALRYLRSEDRLQVIAVGDSATACFTDPQPLNARTRRGVQEFLDAMRPEGGFDLAAGLTRARGTARMTGRTQRLLVLTDSRPAVELDLASWEGLLGREAGRPRVLTVGLGVDCDALLLDHLARETGGEAAWIGPQERLDTKLPRLLLQWFATALSDIDLQLPGALGHRQSPAVLPDLPRDETIFVAGRYAKPGRPEVVVTDRGGPVERAFGRLLWLAGKGTTDQGQAPLRIWAQRRQTQLSRALRTAATPDFRQVRELVALTTKHGLLTEHTEWIADEGADHTEVAANEARCLRAFQEETRDLEGALALAQVRNEEARMRRARAPVRTQGSWFPMRGARDLAWVPWPDVRLIGDRCFFYRHRLGWVDAQIDDLASIDAEVLRWSASFFALIQTTSPVENACLAQPGTVLLAVGGRVFRIVDTP